MIGSAPPRYMEIRAIDPAASHSDEDFPRSALGKGKLGELERVIIDRPWAGDSPRLHPTPDGFCYGVSRSSSDSCPIT